MEIRDIKEEEFKEFKKLGNYGFSKWEDEVKDDDDKLDWYRNADNIGVFEKEKLASGVIIHDFEQAVRGDIKKMGGIGGVATYPEYRNQGLVSKLMDRSFKRMKDNGQPVSMLNPFKESFYEKYQYVSTNNNMKLEVSMESFEHYRDYEAEGDWEEVRKPSKESQEDYLSLMRKVAPDKHHGIVFLDRKSEGIWHVYSKDNIFVFIKRNGEIVSGAKYTKKGFQEIFDTGVIDISQMYWVDIESRNMLFRYFAKHLDQIEKIKMFVPYGVNFYSWLKNNKTIKAEFQPFPWMVRIIDVEDAMSNISVQGEGSAVIKVIDAYCEWNNNNYRLESRDGKLSAEKTDEQEDLTITIDGLSSLLYGAYSFKVTEKLYPIDYKKESKRELLKGWFPKKMIFNPNFF